MDVLATTRPVVDAARHVTIDREQLERRCQAWRQDFQVPPWNAAIHLSDPNYILLLDALNFCFWADPGEPSWQVAYNGEIHGGYNALAAALKRAVEEGVPLTNADYLASLTEEQLAYVLRGNQGHIPLPKQRLSNAREVGTVLQSRFQGQFANAIKGSALQLVRVLVENFPSFRDVAIYNGQQVWLLKRAQITAVDLFGAGCAKFDDLEKLTAFADYKIPQVLRALGILVYSSELAHVVDSMRQLPAGSPEEVEIRSCMIWAVEWISQSIGRPAYEIDWLLWNVGQSEVENQRPYHRTRTIFY